MTQWSVLCWDKHELWWKHSFHHPAPEAALSWYLFSLDIGSYSLGITKTLSHLWESLGNQRHLSLSEKLKTTWQVWLENEQIYTAPAESCAHMLRFGSLDDISSKAIWQWWQVFIKLRKVSCIKSQTVSFLSKGCGPWQKISHSLSW